MAKPNRKLMGVKSLWMACLGGKKPCNESFSQNDLKWGYNKKQVNL